MSVTTFERPKDVLLLINNLKLIFFNDIKQKRQQSVTNKELRSENVEF